MKGTNASIRRCMLTAFNRQSPFDVENVDCEFTATSRPSAIMPPPLSPWQMDALPCARQIHFSETSIRDAMAEHVSAESGFLVKTCMLCSTFVEDSVMPYPNTETVEDRSGPMGMGFRFVGLDSLRRPMSDPEGATTALSTARTCTLHGASVFSSESIILASKSVAGTAVWSSMHRMFTAPLLPDMYTTAVSNPSMQWPAVSTVRFPMSVPEHCAADVALLTRTSAAHGAVPPYASPPNSARANDWSAEMMSSARIIYLHRYISS